MARMGFAGCRATSGSVGSARDVSRLRPATAEAHVLKVSLSHFSFSRASDAAFRRRCPASAELGHRTHDGRYQAGFSSVIRRPWGGPALGNLVKPEYDHRTGRGGQLSRESPLLQQSSGAHIKYLAERQP
jgi:hypothetical protein